MLDKKSLPNAPVTDRSVVFCRGSARSLHFAHHFPPLDPDLSDRGRDELHRRHALLSQSGHSKNAPRRGRRSREAGYGTEPLKVFTWRGLPHPAGVLALIARGRRHSRRAASIRARTYGMIMSQHATVSAPIRHRPLPRSPGSRPAFPCRRWPEYRPGRSGVDNSARLFFAVERNQWVG